jgi:carbamoyl-phosphate synthase large subunit
MQKLLLSGLGGSLFPYLHEKLSTKYQLYYVDSDSLLSSLYPTYSFFPAPSVADPSYIEFIKAIILKFGIDVYVPLIDEELIKVKLEVEGFNNVKVLTPTSEFCELSLNKFKLMKKLNEKGISTINSWIGNDIPEWNFPIFVKPISGRGSRGIKKIINKEQLNAYYLLEGYSPNEILIQEFISGTEYTIGATVNNLNNLISVSIKRVIRKKGITQIAVTEKNEFITNLVKQVVEELKPCGPINIQLFLTADNQVKLFEINPRFSTTTVMSYADDIDEIALFLENFNIQYNKDPIQPRAGITLHRRWENVFYVN